MNIKNCYIHTYNSMSELNDFCETNIGKTNMGYLKSEEISEHSDKFTKTHTLEDAIKLSKKGCEDIIKDIDLVLDLKRHYSRIKSKKDTNDTIGFMPNVPLYLSGLPNCMINKKEYYKRNTSKVINAYINTTFPYDWTTEEIINTQSMKIKQLLELQEQGYKINTYAFSSIVFPILHQRSFDLMIFSVKIKDSNDYLNISRLSYPLCHPSFLRRHMSKCCEIYVDENKYFSLSGYGSTFTNKDVLKQKLNSDYIL